MILQRTAWNWRRHYDPSATVWSWRRSTTILRPVANCSPNTTSEPRRPLTAPPISYTKLQYAYRRSLRTFRPRTSATESQKLCSAGPRPSAGTRRSRVHEHTSGKVASASLQKWLQRDLYWLAYLSKAARTLRKLKMRTDRYETERTNQNRNKKQEKISTKNANEFSR